jgi:Panthothenate synthetase
VINLHGDGEDHFESASGVSSVATEREAEGLATLHAAGFKPEYFSIRRAVDLALPRQDDQKLVILAAAWLGKDPADR